ncbi:MAG: zinc-binding dehydrogenase [Syntrophaceae bacterium]|nr:zinc-binding dehydrogenase [Syntrophaceae bacterium]
MKAAVFYGVQDIRVVEVAKPRPMAGEVLVKVKYCGICGSDLHEYRHGLFPESPFGHEACGEVVEVGAQVKGFRMGDRVLPFFKGAYADYMVCPQERLLGIPPNITWERAAVVEPLAVAAYSVKKGNLQSGITALIAGAGPVGLMTLLALRCLGVSQVYVTEVLGPRREKAKELGATSTCNPLETSVSSWIKERTAGRGVDVAFESVGIEATLKDCLTSVRVRGMVIVQGIFTDRVPIHMLGFVSRETTMIGVNSANPALALEWIETQGIQPERIVTRILPLEKISEAFELLTAEKKREIKVLIEP